METIGKVRKQAIKLYLRMKKPLREGWKNGSFLGKRELKAYEELDGWQLSMSSGQVVQKGMS